MERLRFYLPHSANPGYKGLFSPADILHIELEEVSPPLTIQIANYTEYRQEIACQDNLLFSPPRTF